MNGTASNRTIRRSVPLALCLLGVECGEDSPSFLSLAAGAELFVGAGAIATCALNADVLLAAAADVILGAHAHLNRLLVSGQGDWGRGRCH